MKRIQIVQYIYLNFHEISQIGDMKNFQKKLVKNFKLFLIFLMKKFSKKYTKLKFIVGGKNGK